MNYHKMMLMMKTPPLIEPIKSKKPALQNAEIEWKNPYANPVIIPNLGIKLIDNKIPPIHSIANTISIIFLVKLTIPDKSP